MTGPRSEKGNGLFPGYTVLTVAGSDSGGGAGVQADLKTIMALDGYGTCAITALTAQNTLGVLGSIAVPGLFIQKQMEAVFSDLPPQAVKIGMLPNAEAIAAVAETLLLQKKAYVARGEELPVVLDPVMVSTSGSALLEPEALSCMQEKLFPLCSLLTPNLPEGEKLLGTSIKSPKEMEEAARPFPGASAAPSFLKVGTARLFLPVQRTASVNSLRMKIFMFFGFLLPGWMPKIPMEPAALFPPPLPAAWPAASLWKSPYGRQRPI